jgi:hypothetical protein
MTRRHRLSHNAACFLCNSCAQVHRHHIDWDHSNNSPSNVIVLCQRCHAEAHKCGYVNRAQFETVRRMAIRRDPSRFERRIAPSSVGQVDLFE